MNEAHSESHSELKPIFTAVNYSGMYINWVIGDRVFRAELNGTTGQISARQHGEFNENEHAASHMFMEILRAISSGKRIDHYFNPGMDAETRDVYCKCQWMRSGKLRVIDEQCTKKFNHATSLEEAVQGHRTFTCTRELLPLLPKKRSVAAKTRIPGKPRNIYMQGSIAFATVVESQNPVTNNPPQDPLISTVKEEDHGEAE